MSTRRGPQELEWEGWRIHLESVRLELDAHPQGAHAPRMGAWFGRLARTVVGRSLEVFATNSPLQSSHIVDWVLCMREWREHGPRRCVLHLQNTAVCDEALAVLVGGMSPLVRELVVDVRNTHVTLASILPQPTMQHLEVRVDCLPVQPPIGWKRCGAELRPVSSLGSHRIIE